MKRSFLIVFSSNSVLSSFIDSDLSPPETLSNSCLRMRWYIGMLMRESISQNSRKEIWPSPELSNFWKANCMLPNFLASLTLTSDQNFDVTSGFFMLPFLRKTSFHSSPTLSSATLWICISRCAWILANAFASATLFLPVFEASAGDASGVILPIARGPLYGAKAVAALTSRSRSKSKSKSKSKSTTTSRDEFLDTPSVPPKGGPRGDGVFFCVKTDVTY
mmetsp:Transcript_82446/g.172662  ORF Transcript_82446/g.172662 Transcript_82446/m.172662 type:complete len:220 (+) Transcript_82446:402-1061(+)